MTPLRTRTASGAVAAALTVVLVIGASACAEVAPTGSPVCRRGSPHVTIFQGPGGDCLSRDRVVGYRCEGAEPIVVFDAGSADERRFLGGAFAVPVPSPPRGAEVVGVGDGAQLITVPDEPRRLYTVRGSSTWRWLALPDAAVLAAEAPAAFLLGDSLLDGGAPTLIASLPEWRLDVDALNGRGSATGAAIAESRVTEDQVVVVELGTNDRSANAFETNAERILSSFHHVPLVIWQNVEGPPDVVPADEINAAIELLAGRRPNVAIADWDAAMPEEYLSDGVHPDPEHQDALAALVAPMLEAWRAAATTAPGCD